MAKDSPPNKANGQPSAGANENAKKERVLRRREIVETVAIIIGHRRGAGILLCKLPGDGSILETLDKYKRNPDGVFWYARYRASAIRKSDREMLSGYQSASHTPDVFTGRVVECKIERRARWEAVNIRLDPMHIGSHSVSFRIRKYGIPKLAPSSGRNKKKIRGRTGLGKKRVQARVKAASKVKSNVGRPWRG